VTALRVAAALAGLWAGVMASFVHRHVLPAGGVDLPWGLLAGVVLTFLAGRGAEALVPLGTACFSAGWAVAVLAPLVAGGDSYLVADDLLGWAFTLGGGGALVAASQWKPRLVP
jgi:hypothetical protein